MNHLQKQLCLHEGVKLEPYKCTAGKLTIGVGRNIEDIGISEEEAMFLLDSDIARVRDELDRALPWWSGLSEARRNVLIDMCFNLGISRLLQFKNALTAIEEGRYDDGATEMLDSRWAKQVGARAENLAEAMRSDTLVEVE
jgi:lysozyme